MKRFLVNPMPTDRYRSVAIVAWWAQALIVITGAAVRLTDSGLGCENWPTCTQDRVIPQMGVHSAIEFGNRMLSGFVVATVVMAIIGARRLETPRRDLVALSWGLMAGVIGQIVLGRFVVTLDLNPVSVIGHFLLSIALLWAATLLMVGASQPTDVANHPPADPFTRRLGISMVLVGLTVITLGTMVTGTGPNGGDVRADRLPLDLASVARAHAISAWILVAIAVTFAIRLQQTANRDLARRGRLLVALVLTQGSIGYIQYWQGVHPGLVIFHIAGAIGVWTLCVSTNARLKGQINGKSAVNEVTNATEVDTIGL